MKRFNDEDFNFDNEDFTNDPMFDEEFDANQIQAELANKDINQYILKTSIQFAEKSFFWKFFRLNTKLKIIAKTYVLFSNLVEDFKNTEE